VKRWVLAVPEPQYTAKLARYMKEKQPQWEVKAFTQELALIRYLSSGEGADAIAVHESMLTAAREAIKAGGFMGKMLVLRESNGETESSGNSGRNEAGAAAGTVLEDGTPTIPMYRPLSALLNSMAEELLGSAGRGGHADPGLGAAIWTVFSASGGAGKTTVAMNLVRQLGERGYRALYLNLEPLNATDLLFGRGDPDSLSGLLYELQARPDQMEEEWKKRRRQHSVLLGDYLDAPEHPAERLAMSPSRMKELLGLVAGSGRYEVVVVDPDSGSGEWHQELLAMSDRIAWLVTPEAMSVRKTEKQLRYWQSKSTGLFEKVSWLLNKASGSEELQERLPQARIAARLPYMPQWKGLEEIDKLLRAPAFCGAVEKIVEEWGCPVKEDRPSRASRRRGAASGDAGAIFSRIS